MRDSTLLRPGVDTIDQPHLQPPAEIGRTRLASAEQWLRERLDYLALAIVFAALLARIHVARQVFLNPDEALHYLLINQGSVFRMYRASLTNAHPPLFYFVLYFWHFFGRSELMLRLPSVLAGTLFCWVSFKWMKIVAGEAASLVALTLLAFSPATIALSGEVRSYAVMLLCMACALYFAARAFGEESLPKMWLFSCFLYLAILSHYSVVFFTASIGVYALARFAELGYPRKLLWSWAAGQAGAVLLYAFLYVTHVSKLKDSIAVWGRPFDSAYFHIVGGNLFTFTGINTWNIFLFFFAQRIVAAILLSSFVVGLILLFSQGLIRRGRQATSDHLGALLLFPFLAVWGASLAGIYPYVGSRHTIFLEPFAVAGASYSIAVIARRQIWVCAVAAAVLMAFANMAARPVEPKVSLAGQSPKVMTDAMAYLGTAVPPGDHILVDFQSSLPFTYYFCDPRNIVPIEAFGGSTFDFNCKGNPIISLRIWKVIDTSFAEQFEMAVRLHHMKPGDRVWFYQTGWGDTLDSKLDRQEPNFHCLSPVHFGAGIVVIPFVVGSDDRPVAASSNCSN